MIFVVQKSKTPTVKREKERVSGETAVVRIPPVVVRKVVDVHVPAVVVPVRVQDEDRFVYLPFCATAC